MRKVVFAFGGLVAALALLFSLFLGWTILFRPLVRATTNRKFDSTPQRLERGRYLVENVASCLRCHSPNHMRKPVGNARGSGAIFLPENTGPHRIVASNITPDKETGIGLWSDDEIGRTIREGVARDGRSLGLSMPYQHYHSMADEDLASVVVYLRTLTPVRNALPPTKLMFPVPFLARLLPRPITSPVNPDQSTAEKRGQYLTTIATCAECHSSHDPRHHTQEGLEFAGGDVLKDGSTPATIANITPDETGIRSLTAEGFRAVLRTGQRDGRKLHGLMPYDQYADLRDADLNDMYAYLRTVKPIRHLVDATATVTACRVCRNQHGGGERN